MNRFSAAPEVTLKTQSLSLHDASHPDHAAIRTGSTMIGGCRNQRRRTGFHIVHVGMAIVSVCLLAGSSPSALAAEIPALPLPESRNSLHQRIDDLVRAADADFDRLAAPACSDAEFLRRVSLDLIGRIPSVDETRGFLADDTPSAQKRRAAIDRLLSSPEHTRHLTDVFDLMLMEGRGGANVADAEWRQWLRDAFARNRPWDDIAEDILRADGVPRPHDTSEPPRAAAKFLLDRELDADLVTRDIGRIFLGRDLECAQCHDHPNVAGYLQRHYYGINAFVKRSYLFTDPKSKLKVIGEKAEGDVKFTSVFTQEEGLTAPRMLDLPEITDPEGFEKAYFIAPDKSNRGVPKYSRRLQLARALLSDSNSDFRMNIANRLWALMLGRGLIEPLDLRHPDNPPTHPELLDTLAEEFRRQRFNIRWFLRELALSDTYQRSSRVADESQDRSHAIKLYAVSPLKPLSPEQLAWSVMEATGVRQTTLQAETAKLLKADPANGAARKHDPAWQAEVLEAALKPHIDPFVQKFSRQGGQRTDFASTAEQALFLMNGQLVQSWLNRSPGSLTDRLCALASEPESSDAEPSGDTPMPADVGPPAGAERLSLATRELFLSVLNRLPTDDEAGEAIDYLAGIDDTETGVRELAWALLASAEFRFNH